MPPQLSTKNVFIDTEVFIGFGLGFSNTLLGRLKNLGKLGKLNLFISDIVQREVYSHLAKKGLTIEKQAKEFSRQTHHFSDIIEPGFIPDLDRFADGAISKTLKSNWQSYIRDSNIIVLDHTSVDLNEVVDRYFDITPPFGNGKKRKEFPDTISVLALRAWLDQHDDEAYVVSGDTDLKLFCEQEPRCMYLKSLPELLNKYHLENSDQSDLIHELLDQNRSEIHRQAKNYFYDCEMLFNDHDDWEMSMLSTQLFEVGEYDIIDSSAESAAVYAQLNVKFTIIVFGFDWQNAIRDANSDDLFPQHFTRNFMFKSTHDLLFDLHFTDKSGDQADIHDLTIDAVNTIELNMKDLIQTFPANATVTSYAKLLGVDEPEDN